MGIFQNLTGWHALIILAVIILMFGATKLPTLAKSVGQSMNIFKTEIKASAPTATATDVTDGGLAASAAVPAAVTNAVTTAVPGTVPATVPTAAAFSPAVPNEAAQNSAARLSEQAVVIDAR